MTVWTIRAEYDLDASVWWVAESDLPGLAADGATLEELAEKAGRMLPDLLAIHADQLAGGKGVGGRHQLKIIAHHERLFDVAV